MASGYSTQPKGEIMARRIASLLTLVLLLGLAPLRAAGGLGSINGTDLREWLSYIASDELQGRAVFTEGLGLAAGYIQAHLQGWGVKPLGDNGGFLQTV